VSSWPFLIALLFAADPSVPATVPDRELAERAEAEFAEGVRLRQAAEQARPHFRAAAEAFDELRRRGARNPTLYRNLGNACLLADDLPGAILSYRRGLRLAPYDRALRANLDAARERVVYPPYSNFGRPSRDPRPPWLPRLPAEWLAITAAAGYVLAWVFLTRWLMTRRGRLLLAAALLLVVAVGLSGVVVVLARGEQDQEAHPLVVIAQDGVLLRRGDGLAFPPRYETPVNRGVEARLLFERGAWLQIELSGGEVGWVPREYALVDRE
jgi:hypothetical protein